MSNNAIRTIERYLVPGFITTLYFFFRYRCLVSPAAKVQLSKKIMFGKGTVVKPFAVIQTSGKGKIQVGRECSVNNFVQIATADADILIGDFVRIGPSVTILGSSRNYKRKDTLILHQGFSHGETVIEDDVLIASGSIILKGCLIGRGSVVGAGSVVTKDVPVYSVVAGIPARKISERT